MSSGDTPYALAPGEGHAIWYRGTLMVVKAAAEKGKNLEGPKMRDAIETIDGFQGTGGVYNFSPTVHQGITQNPFFLATIVGGKLQVK